MTLPLKLSTRTLKGLILAGLVLAVFVLFAFAILRRPAPRIDTAFGGATIDISADRAWVFAPGDCVTIQWEVEGIKSIYIDDEGKPGWGEMPFCPASDINVLEIGITAQDGTRRIFKFDFLYLPDFILYLLGFAGASFTLLLALYYFLARELDKPFPWWRMSLVAAVLILVGGLLRLSDTVLITDFLSLLKSLFTHPYWQLAGIILAGLIYLPLIVQALRRSLKNKARSEFIVISGFFVFILLLYLPFGFESIGHWEEWRYHAYLEGKPVSWKTERELLIRFWLLIPHTLAYLISSDSFIGYHLVNLVMFWGKLILLYGILRQLKAAPLYAFLMTMLFMVYPVNSGLMSLRSLSIQFSMISLLAAVYLALDYQKHPSRLRLLGIWLGLIFNVASSESAYAMILIIPLIWWLRCRSLTWRNFNLTAIWYTFPACKAAYLLLLVSHSWSFYRSNLLDNALASQGVASDVLDMVIPNLIDVYRNTFVNGWLEAWTALNQNSYLFLTTVMLALVGGVAWHLSRIKDMDAFPSIRQIGIWLVSGLLFVMPAVGVLIWLEGYSGDLWRMYVYVPIGAVLVIFSLIALLTALIARRRFRNVVLIMLCLILMFPALSRLVLQHEHFVNSANSKAVLLHNVLEIAPRVMPETILILTAEMSLGEFEATDIVDYSKFDLVNSIFYILYQPHAPAHAALCLPGPWCSYPRDFLEQHSDDFVKKHLQNILLFKINEDWSVELVEQSAAYFGIDSDLSYDANRLYSPDAPLPPRAATMLGSALRE